MSENAGVGVSARLAEAVGLWLAGDWAGLIAWAKAHGIATHDIHWDDPYEYEWKGDHGEDARYTAPMRFNLMAACFAYAITLDGVEGAAETTRDGEATHGD